MSDLTLLAAFVLSPMAANSEPVSWIQSAPDATTPTSLDSISQNPVSFAINPPDRLVNQNEFASPLRPQSGAQLFSQRLAALRSGRLYTRLPVDSFQPLWQQAWQQPTYQQWRQLLAAEARAVAAGQGSNRLSILLGDSLSLWFPCDRLPHNHLWLNQGISGDTTRGILQRLGDFAQTRPRTIYLMAGVNDLKMGFTDTEILNNLHRILMRLQQQHPQAQIVMQSILPTRTQEISNYRIQHLNQALWTMSQRYGVTYLDVHTPMADPDGFLQTSLTTDGLHLNPQGYQTWEWLLRGIDSLLAQTSVQ